MRNASGISGFKVLIGLVLAAALAAGAWAVWRADWTGRQGNRLGADYQYDLSEAMTIDPLLVRYEQAAAIATGFQRVRALAAGPGGRIYVAGDKAVRVFRRDGAAEDPLLEVLLDAEPRCLTVAADGTIYVGMSDHVEVFDADGRPLARWESPSAGDQGSKAMLTALAATDQTVFAADYASRSVIRFGRDGKVLGRIGGRGAGADAPRFIVPSPYFDLAAADDGTLWVANPGRWRLEAYAPDGTLKDVWGEFGTAVEKFCGCCNPAHFALLADGRFVTSEKGIARVKVYGPEGAFECVVAGPAELGQPGGAGAEEFVLDVAAGEDGTVLVLDPVRREVGIYKRKVQP